MYKCKHLTLDGNGHREISDTSGASTIKDSFKPKQESFGDFIAIFKKSGPLFNCMITSKLVQQEDELWHHLKGAIAKFISCPFDLFKRKMDYNFSETRSQLYIMNLMAQRAKKIRPSSSTHQSFVKCGQKKQHKML